MKKRRIVLASILKPVNDTRMFEKMGISLANSEKYEIHIIGYPTETKFFESKIQFHPLPAFRRLSVGRLLARLKTLQILINVKPELILVTTHELLGVAILNRIIFGSKIIYDVQENYWLNIRHTNAFPRILRGLIAFLVRAKELVTAPFVSRFILAEKCYAEELNFVRDKFSIIENKCKIPEGFVRKLDPDFIRLIFTGTLAESTGIFQAIDLAKKLHAFESKIRLDIIGFCAQPKLIRKIEKAISQDSYITLVGGGNFVSHSIIRDAIATANFGLICYPPSPHLENKIPTKLFEYLACHLPILLQDHERWVQMCLPCKASIKVDFEEPDVAAILTEIRRGAFYTSFPEGMTWQNEETIFMKVIEHL